MKDSYVPRLTGAKSDPKSAPIMLIMAQKKSRIQSTGFWERGFFDRTAPDDETYGIVIQDRTFNFTCQVSMFRHCWL